MKINLIVSQVLETHNNKGKIILSADKNPNELVFNHTLYLEANKGEFDVGDLIQVTIEKVEKK